VAPRFTLVQKDWFKRRSGDKKFKHPINVEVIDFKKVDQHFCTLVAHYSDGSKREFIARVLQNHITKSWVVDAMEIAVRLIE